MGDLLQSCQTIKEAHEAIARSAQRLFKQGSGPLCLLGPETLVESVAREMIQIEQDDADGDWVLADRRNSSRNVSSMYRRLNKPVSPS